MKKKKTLSSFKRRTLICFLFFVIGSGLLVWGHLSREYTGLFWSRWYPLLIPESAVTDGLTADLLDSTDQGLLFHGNTRYFYYGFNRRVSVSLEDQEQGRGLLPHDPRLDPFMRGAGGYFRQGKYRIFYLPSDRSPIEYRLALRPLWDSAWIFPDAEKDTLFFSFAGLLFLLLIFQAGRGVIPCLLTAVYIGSSAVLGRQDILLPGMICLFLLSHYRKQGKLRLPLTALLPVAALWAFHAGMFTAVDCGVVLCLFLAGLSLKPAAAERKQRKGRPAAGRDHELFMPVPLQAVPVGEEKAPAGKVFFLRPAAVVLQGVLLAILFFQAGTADRSLPVSLPMARLQEGGEWSWDGLSRMDPSHGLPGVREMLMHRAYQEALPYGGTWRFPAEGESIGLPVYTMEEGVIRSSVQVVQLYDREWLEGFFRSMAEEGPGPLLSSEASPPVVSLTEHVPATVPAEGAAVLGLLGILGIILSLLHAAASSRSGPEDYRMRNTLLVFRRKQQAA